jgi:tetratricopeptide (TPR) repeat protein
LSFVELPPLPLRPRVAEIERRLSAARALVATGKYQVAIGALTPVVEDARNTGYQPVLAESLLELGTADNFQSEHPATEIALGDAYTAAIRSHLDTVAARAAAQLMSSAAERGADERTFAQFETTALAWVDRDGDRQAELLVENARGIATSGQDKYEEAVAHFERAAQVAAQVFGEGSTRLFTTQANEGLALSVLGRYDEAIALQQRSLRAMERTYGADNPFLELTLDNYAYTLALVGRYDEARAAAMRGLAMKGVSRVNRAILMSDLCRVLVGQGKADEAIDYGERGIGELHALHIEKLNLAINSDPLAAAYLLGHRNEAALRQARACLAEFDKDRGHTGLDTVSCLVVEGTALLELGNPAEARPELEKALVAQTGHLAPPGVLANIQYQLARALEASGDRAGRSRARELVTAARAELSKLPHKKALLDEIAAWQAKAKLE